jgi:hypothetical protein
MLLKPKGYVWAARAEGWALAPEGKELDHAEEKESFYRDDHIHVSSFSACRAREQKHCFSW